MRSSLLAFVLENGFKSSFLQPLISRCYNCRLRGRMRIKTFKPLYRNITMCVNMFCCRQQERWRIPKSWLDLTMIHLQGERYFLWSQGLKNVYQLLYIFFHKLSLNTQSWSHLLSEKLLMCLEILRNWGRLQCGGIIWWWRWWWKRSHWNLLLQYRFL